MSKQPWYQIRNAAQSDSGPAELLIYDVIDSWMGVSAEQLARDVVAIDDTREITVRINSPGGNAYDGVAILNSLRAHKGKVTVIIDGIAASAASFIAMAGDEIVMNRNSELMVHNGHGVVMGGAEDMRKMAERLEAVNANIASIYAERAGGTDAEWRAIMAAETWYSAEEAVAAGLADRVEATKTSDKVKNHFDLSIFNHAGRNAAPPPRIPQAHTETPLPTQAEAEKGKEPTVATLSESALQKLGLDADADEAAIDEKITELADRPTTTVINNPAEPTIDEATQIAARHGMTVVNSAQWDQSQAALADLTARRDAQIKADNETAIHNALTTGRISNDAADTWRESLAENREKTLSLLNTLPASKAVPVDEIGHGVSREDQPADADKAYAYAQVTGRTLGKDA